MTYTEPHYKKLLDGLQTNLRIIGFPNKSYQLCKHTRCSQQSNSVDCGIMALIFLQNLLHQERTDKITSAQADSFRLNYAKTLLQTTEHGKALLSAYNNNIVDVLKFCCDNSVC